MTATNAEKALALQPDLVEAHLALAYCDSWGRLDYPSALEHLARAQALAPQSPEVLIALGAVYRRQLRFDEAIAVYERAAQYDPGNSKLFSSLATTCLWAGRNDKVQPTSNAHWRSTRLTRGSEFVGLLPFAAAWRRGRRAQGLSRWRSEHATRTRLYLLGDP